MTVQGSWHFRHLASDAKASRVVLSGAEMSLRSLAQALPPRQKSRASRTD